MKTFNFWPFLSILSYERLSYKKERVFEQIFLELAELKKKDLKDFTNEIKREACRYSYGLI